MVGRLLFIFLTDDLPKGGSKVGNPFGTFVPSLLLSFHVAVWSLMASCTCRRNYKDYGGSCGSVDYGDRLCFCSERDSPFVQDPLM